MEYSHFSGPRDQRGLAGFVSDSFFLPPRIDQSIEISRMLSILRKARLKDKEMRILML